MILFFDELCELCSQFIQFISKRNKTGVFLFAALQGETAKKHLELKDIQNLGSLVVLKESKLYREGEALKVILKKLYPSAYFLLALVPPFFLNKMYRFIAKRRYRWFGKTAKEGFSEEIKKSLLP